MMMTGKSTRLKILFFVPLFLWTCGGGGGSTAPEPPQLPTVTNIEVTTLEDTPTTFAFTGTDPLNSALSYSVSTQPQHGAISISGGAGTYTPNANYNGQDVIAYLATSVNGNSNIGTIIITITAVDDEPNTMDVTATTDEDNAVTITLEAEEYDGDNIQFNVTGNPSNGSVTISGTTATYTPNQDWFGTDTFNFEAVDVSSKSILNNATATITVNPINDAPLANNMSVSTDENRIKQLDITLDVTDVDGDNLTYSIVSDVSDGSTSINGDVVTYIPNQDWNGTDTFTFKANDGTVDSNIGNVTIGVNAVNDAPAVNDITLSTNEDISVLPVQFDGNDIDGDSITYSIVTSPSNGVLSTINGNLVGYAPTPNWNGTDTFTYKANDGTLDSNIGAVTITVAAINDAPTVMNITDIQVSINTSVDITLLGSDVDGDDLTYSIVDNPTTGTVNISGDVATFTANSIGEHTFTYKANDGMLDSETGTVILNENWEYSTYGGTGQEWGLTVRQTSDGGYILGGFNEDNKMYIIKTNIYSGEEWSNTYDTGYVSSITQLSDDSFIFVGSGGGSNDIRLIKINSSGTVEWNKGLSVDDNNIGVGFSGQHSFQLTSDGGYIIAGGVRLISNGMGDAYAIKTDANGNQLWSKTYEGLSVGDDGFTSVEQTSDGGYIFAGQTRHSSKGAQFYLVKTDANGTEEWSADYGGSAGDGVQSVEQTSDGGYILSGVGNGSEGYVVKTDATGQIEFEMNDSEAYFNHGIEASDGGYIIIGNSQGSGNADLLVLKLSASGNQEWRKEYGGSNYDSGNSIAKTSDGGYVVFGWTGSYGAGSDDMYLINIDSEGNRIF